MITALYLDTARLGRMCQAAQEADRDFTRLAGEEGCSLYLEQFLRSGFMSLPRNLRGRYPGLAFWSGITAFKRDLRTTVVLPPDRQVLVAGRSAQLVRLAAKALSLRCENILITDMEWPAYVEAVAAECRLRRKKLTCLPIQERLFGGELGGDQLGHEIGRYYRSEGCDGLFLSAVTYRGVRLPIREVVDALDSSNRPRLVVVDAAQAINHIPLGRDAASYDLILAGCHKWLRAYHPLGLAFCGRAQSERFIVKLSRTMLGPRTRRSAATIRRGIGVGRWQPFFGDGGPGSPFHGRRGGPVCPSFEPVQAGTVLHAACQRRFGGRGHRRLRLAAAPPRKWPAIRHPAAAGSPPGNTGGVCRRAP